MATRKTHAPICETVAIPQPIPTQKRGSKASNRCYQNLELRLSG
jgi:hypothetical protein